MPLDGVRVVEVAQYVAGPLAGFMTMVPTSGADSMARCHSGPG